MWRPSQSVGSDFVSIMNFSTPDHLPWHRPSNRLEGKLGGSLSATAKQADEKVSVSVREHSQPER
jgi:hypothetical protein